jgi:hypothetical protein
MKQNREPDQIDPVERLVLNTLRDMIKDSVNPKVKLNERVKILNWIFDDPPVGHKYKIPFNECCEFIGFNSDVITQGFDKHHEKFAKTKKIYFCNQGKTCESL